MRLIPLARIREMEQKIAELEAEKTCLICDERPKNVVFLCGHGACAVCSGSLATCHLCRAVIRRRIKVY
jgi:E3 ubiquitin-protein ligase mind-bomb